MVKKITAYLVGVVGRAPMIAVITDQLKGDVESRIALEMGVIARDVRVVKVAEFNAETNDGVGFGINPLIESFDVRLPELLSMYPEEWAGELVLRRELDDE